MQSHTTNIFDTINNDRKCTNLISNYVYLSVIVSIKDFAFCHLLFIWKNYIMLFDINCLLFWNCTSAFIEFWENQRNIFSLWERVTIIKRIRLQYFSYFFFNLTKNLLSALLEKSLTILLLYCVRRQFKTLSNTVHQYWNTIF